MGKREKRKRRTERMIFFRKCRRLSSHFTFMPKSKTMVPPRVYVRTSPIPE